MTLEHTTSCRRDMRMRILTSQRLSNSCQSWVLIQNIAKWMKVSSEVIITAVLLSVAVQHQLRRDHSMIDFHMHLVTDIRYVCMKASSKYDVIFYWFTQLNNWMNLKQFEIFYRCIYRIIIVAWFSFFLSNFFSFFQTQGLVGVLSDDNLAFEIPSYLRKNLELDLQTRPEKLPSGLLLQVYKFKMP